MSTTGFTFFSDYINIKNVNVTFFYNFLPKAVICIFVPEFQSENELFIMTFLLSTWL